MTKFFGTKEEYKELKTCLGYTYVVTEVQCDCLFILLAAKTSTVSLNTVSHSHRQSCRLLSEWWTEFC